LAGSWSLTTFVDEDVAISVLAGTEITLTLDPAAGTLTGHAGCNGFNGGITVDTGAGEVPATIVVGPLTSTLMSCEPDVMDQESMFHSILGQATEMQTDTAFLTISTDDGRALIFEPAGE
jgi:heat shock protein HslJ